MRNHLILFLIWVFLFSCVVSLPDAWNETESLLIGKAVEDPCSCSENCYFTMKPLLEYASECHKKDIEICNLKLAIREQNEKLDKQNEKEKQFNMTIDEKIAKIDERDSKITNLKNELKNAKNQLEDNSKNIEKLNRQLEESKKNLDNAQTRLEDNLKTIEKLNRTNENKKNISDNAIKSWEQQLKESDKKAANTIQEKQSKILELTAAIQELEDRCQKNGTGLTTEINDLKLQNERQLNQCIASIKSKDAIIKENVNAVQQKIMEISEIESKLNQKEDECKQHKYNINILEKQLNDKQKLITDGENQLGKCQAESKEKKIQLNSSMQENAITSQRKATEINDLKLEKERQLNQCKANISNLEDQLNQIQRITNEKDNLIKSKDSIIKEYLNAVQQKTMEISEIESKLNQKEDKCKQHKYNINILEKQLNDKQKLIQDKQREINELNLESQLKLNQCHTEVKNIKTEEKRTFEANIFDLKVKVDKWKSDFRLCSRQKVDLDNIINANAVMINNNIVELDSLKKNLYICRNESESYRRQLNFGTRTIKKDKENFPTFTFSFTNSMVQEYRTNQHLFNCDQKKNGIHKIQNFDQELLWVCSSGWIVIQHRIDDSVNFNRTWKEYQLGFGYLNTNFFFGLDRLHTLTQSQPFELLIHVQGHNGEKLYAHYDNFIVGSENEAYKLKSIGNYRGTAGNVLFENVNMPFSTFDHNSNWRYSNYAKLCGAGWWFNNCGLSCLNCKYPDGSAPLTYTKMMVKAKDFNPNIFWKHVH